MVYKNFQNIKRKKILERQVNISKLVSNSLIHYILQNYSKKLLQKLKKNQLISKILKEKYFWKYKFYTNNFTLDPREDTELVVELFLKFYKKEYGDKLLDACAGTGAIGISILMENPALKCSFLDISQKALQVCKKNIRAHKLWHRSKVLKISLENITPETYDFLVSNPPYLLDSEILGDIKQDPYIALYGGEDGLYFYRLLAKYIKNFIKVFAIIEIDHYRAEKIYNIVLQCEFSQITLYKDSYGFYRAIYIKV